MLGHLVAALVPLGYRGMCVTVPYKVAVIPLLDEADDDVCAMAVEIAWAGAAMMTLVMRRAKQDCEAAALVEKASGVPSQRQAWQQEVEVPAGTTLLMNATHLGCAPELEPVPVLWDTVSTDCAVVAVITNPRITPFLATARDRGCRTVDGVEMLVQLAMQIFQRWTGLAPEEKVFQRAVAEALGE
ncbi:MAG: hypothetical protein O3A75_02945 [Verrucomicrobia bacterium]|nr:hypothetical protein [Verrucomicrobiota bacterium]MDA1203256.1 hypothetical protein [Verrucomicrobiota bacterium]